MHKPLVLINKGAVGETSVQQNEVHSASHWRKSGKLVTKEPEGEGEAKQRGHATKRAERQSKQRTKENNMLVARQGHPKKKKESLAHNKA